MGKLWKSGAVEALVQSEQSLTPDFGMRSNQQLGESRCGDDERTALERQFRARRQCGEFSDTLLSQSAMMTLESIAAVIARARRAAKLQSAFDRSRFRVCRGRDI